MSRRGPKIHTPNNSKPDRALVALQTTDKWLAPAYLTDTARDEFNRLVGELRARGTIARADIRAIELAAIAYDVLIVAYAALRANANDRDALETINRMTIRLSGLISKLGLSPDATTSKSAAKNATTAGGYSQWAHLLEVSADGA